MINFSGLASGLDTQALIEQMLAAERMPARRLERHQQALGGQRDVVSELKSDLEALEDVARDLDTATELRAMKGTSSDEDTIDVTVSGSAQAGTYEMRVNSLARAQTNVSQGFATADAGVLGDGSVDIQVGSDAAVNVAWDSTDSLYDIAERINASDARVDAQVLHDGTDYQIMVTSEESGTANAVAYTDNGDGLGLGAGGSETVAAADAELELNGTTITRSSNVVDDVLEGVTFNLESIHATGDPDTTVQVERDPESQKESLQKLVDAYNDIVDRLGGQLEYDGETKGSHTLFADSTLRSLQRRLNGIVTDSYTSGDGTTSLGLLGIELDSSGKLSIDEDKLEEATENDPAALSNLFLGDGGDGLLTRFKDTVTLYTRSGDGLLTAKTESLTDRISDYDDQIQRIEDHAARMGETLRQQFAALERTMSQLQAQSGYLSSLA